MSLGRKLHSLASTTARGARLFGFLAVDSLCLLSRPNVSDTVVVVRLDALGDFFIWIQSGAADVAAYAKRMGGQSVLVANNVWAEFARQSHLWNDVIAVDTRRFMRNPFYRFGLLRRIRALGISVLIQPRAARVFLQEDALARVSGAKQRIGSAATLINTSPRLRRLGDRYYERLLSVDESRNVHELVRNRHFARELTGGCERPFGLPRSAMRPDLVAVALGAGQAGRVWPPEKLAGLLRHVNERYAQMRLMLLGTDAERATVEWLQGRGLVHLEDRVGQTSVLEYVAILASAALVICNDSSAYHIAKATGRRVVCFLGGGHYGWFAPYPEDETPAAGAAVLNQPMSCYWCNWQCIYPRSSHDAFRCVQDIALETAKSSLDVLLSSLQAPSTGK